MRNEKRQEKRMQTELTRLLGIQAPIIQGGMAWVAEHTLAAAVSNAGGLGIIGAANAPAEWVREQIRLTKQLTDTCMTTQFSHIMAGGYAAGYYSYKWAEVLDADAFSVFKKNGIFDQKTAQSFRDNILSKGGTEHPMTLYKRFRGQEPTIDALLERNGIKH